MFSKSARFPSDAPFIENRLSQARKRDLPAEIQHVDDDNQSGTFNAKEKTVEDYQSQISQEKKHSSPDKKKGELKKAKSTDRKSICGDKKKDDRTLKRTISLIPRATSIPRAKTQTSVDDKKPGRKSETALKTKELYDVYGRDKSFDTSNSEKGTGGETDASRTDAESKKEMGIGSRRTVSAKKESSHSTMIKKRPFSRGSSITTEKVDTKSTDKLCMYDKKGTLESQYTSKKTIYKVMIKQYHKKQNEIREQYKILEELRCRILRDSGKEMEPGEVIIIGDLGPPFFLADALRIKEVSSEIKRREMILFESSVLKDIQMDYTEFYQSFDDILNQSQEIWYQLIPMISQSRNHILDKIEDMNPSTNLSELRRDETLELAIENAKYCFKTKCDKLAANIKQLYENREVIRQELETVMNSEKITALLNKDYKDLVVKMKELEEEIMKEKVRTEHLTERRHLLENMHNEDLRKIELLEQANVDLQGQLSQMNLQLKSIKQREVNNRGSGSIKQKDLKDLKAKSELLRAMENHITEVMNDFNAQKREYETRIGKLEESINEKDEALKAGTRLKETLEASLADAEDRLKNVREKKKIFSEMVDETKQILQSNNSTKREEHLWMELEATKIIVKGYQDQLNKLNEDKNKLLLRFQTISEDKSNHNSERLAADLVRKEEIISSLKEQVAQMQSACEEHSAKYNKLLSQVKEAHEKIDGKADTVTLTKQLGDMKLQKKELQEVVRELVSHNEELETALVQRSLELDQRDRLVKQQCNLLKMRDELTDLVRSKDDAQYEGVKKVMEQSSKWEKRAEKIYKDLEKKANELDSMYKVLVEKQKQVEKLTRLVKIMEDQQEKAQEQRVRFESKIADLQKQLSEGRQIRTLKTQLFGQD